MFDVRFPQGILIEFVRQGDQANMIGKRKRSENITYSRFNASAHLRCSLYFNYNWVVAAFNANLDFANIWRMLYLVDSIVTGCQEYSLILWVGVDTRSWNFSTQRLVVSWEKKRAWNVSKTFIARLYAHVLCSDLSAFSQRASWS